MLKTVKTLGIGFLLITVVITTAGCFPLLVGAAAGAGGFAWVNGVLEKNFNVSLNTAYTATKKGLKRLELPIVSDKKDKFVATITSEYADGKKIAIAINALTERTSKIKIRVGVFGDQQKSETILSAIQRYL